MTYLEGKLQDRGYPGMSPSVNNRDLTVENQRTRYADLFGLPRNEREMFANGVKRHPGEILLEPSPGRVPKLIIELGQGNNPIPGTMGFSSPAWAAPYLELSNGSVCAVHAHHFLEHLNFEEVLNMMTEIDRVLMLHGVAYITVPHAQSALGYGSADHKTFWTEKTFQTMFYSRDYDAKFGKKWDLNISYMSIAGINFHELCLLVQLVKDPNYNSPWVKS